MSTMKRIISGLTLGVCALALSCGASAQGRSSLKINEVMVANENSVVDEYGNRNAWIELFNLNFAPMEISAVYLTNDSLQPRKYPVPLGDVNTEIPARQHVVFFADGEPNKGTFHTSFTLTPGQDNWIGVYDADGITLIDEVLIPASLEPDQTWARTSDGTGEWALRTGDDSAYITPGGANVIKDTNKKIEMFAERDENGFGMTIMAMCVVFSALLLLCLSFYGIGKIGAGISKLNKMRAHGVTRDEAAEHHVTHDSGEEIAAITMALYEHLNAHDTESTILTINKVKRAYSPWSSKIYGLREVPEHRRK
ncbi:MAG: OadG family protein [Muribaculaceae bacterium]|nr:OadG family protein [Muribaculaceae bacterium]